MATSLGHPLVRDYLGRVDAALTLLPHGQACELREQIAAHIEDALPPDAGDKQVVAVLERIGSPNEIATEALRGERAAVEGRAGESVVGRQRMPTRNGSRRGRRVVIAAVAAVCLSAAALAVSLTRGGDQRRAVHERAVGIPVLLGSTEAQAESLLTNAGFKVAVTCQAADTYVSPVPVISTTPQGVASTSPPGTRLPVPAGTVVGTKPAGGSAAEPGSTVRLIVAGRLACLTNTAPVLLATGQVGQLTWQFWAKLTPPSAKRLVIDGHLVFQPGLSTYIDFAKQNNEVGGGSGPTVDPRNLPRVRSGGIGPGSGLNARMLMGITTAVATTIRIDFGHFEKPMTVGTVTDKAFPGVSFFVVNVPDRHIRAIDGLGADGKVLFHAPLPL